MTLYSQYSRKLFWRVFNPDDNSYIVGLKEGTLLSGQSIEYNHPSGKFKIEIKKNDLWGALIFEAAAAVFINDAIINITDDQVLLNKTKARIDYLKKHDRSAEGGDGTEQLDPKDEIEGHIVTIDGFGNILGIDAGGGSTVGGGGIRDIMEW